MNTFKESHLIPLLYFDSRNTKLASKLLCLVWMIVQAEHQVLVAAMSSNNYKVQRKLHKYHVVICVPSFVLLLIPLCFASRLRNAVLRAEVDAIEKAIMSTLSIILVQADNRAL